MQSIDYQSWAASAHEMFGLYGIPGRTVLDLACGTGKFLDFLSAHGYTGKGLDISHEMLQKAREKYRSNKDISFTQGDMRAIELQEAFAAVVCLHDSMNYLKNLDELGTVLEEAAGVLKPGGLFIFDLCTKFSIIRNFSGQAFSEDTEDYSYIWKNSYSRFSGRAGVRIDFIIKHKDGNRYGREYHEQHIFSLASVEKRIKACGLYHLLGCFDEFSTKPAGRRTETATFVLKRRA